MKVTVNGRHLLITDSINEYAVKKMDKLDKYFDNLGNINVTLSAVKLKTGPAHTAELIATMNGNILKAVSTEDDLYAAIDKAQAVLERQIRKNKSKLRDNKFVTTPRVFKYDAESNTISSSQTKKIVKVSLETKPMNLEEAILQMEALSKDFNVFFNSETEEINVVYKKRDGNYGHIEPTIENSFKC